MAAYVAAMTASLASKLSLSKQEEPVDLRGLRSPAKGFVAPRFYLMGRVNTVRAVEFEPFRSATRNIWRLANLVEVYARGDRFLFSFINEREKNRVKRDQSDLNRGNARVCITLPLNDPVRLEHGIRVSPVDVLQVSYSNGRLLGRCRDYMMINHGGLRCPRVLEDLQEVTLPPTAPPTMVFRASALGSGSTSLLVPAVSLPKEKRTEEIGLSVQTSGELAIIKTEKSLNKRGRPRGSRNKKKIEDVVSETPDSMPPSGSVEGTSLEPGVLGPASKDPF
ncbi:hypothetical protein ACLB2K_016886 [Fragaria x ananassa]